MKKALSVILTLVLLVCFALPVSAEPGVQNGNSLSVVQPSGGPYVIVTKLDTGHLEFNYGWNNSKQFESDALGYWIGVYNVTDSHYEWGGFENQLSDPNPKMLKLKESLDLVNMESGKEYKIVFFVRDAYDGSGNGVSNVSEIEVFFTAP